jgi:hypothetical protein
MAGDNNPMIQPAAQSRRDACGHAYRRESEVMVPSPGGGENQSTGFMLLAQ